MGEKTYRIGEAAAKLNLKSYVLRFWEMEFPQIAPIRTEKGQRLYRETDLAVLRRIRYLLHERGLTIEGARRLLREEEGSGRNYADAEAVPPEYLADGPMENLEEEAFEEDHELEFSAQKENAGALLTQASLFASGSASKGGGDAGVLSEDELREIILELTVIRGLLHTGATGDMS